MHSVFPLHNSGDSTPYPSGGSLALLPGASAALDEFTVLPSGASAALDESVVLPSGASAALDESVVLPSGASAALDESIVLPPGALAVALDEPSVLSSGASAALDGFPVPSSGASAALDVSSVLLPGASAALLPESPPANLSLPFRAFTPFSKPLSYSPLHSTRIRRLMRNHPDQSFIATLCGIADFGAHIGFEGPSTRRIRRSNHATAYTNAAAVTEAVQKELAKGRIQVLDSLPSTAYFCSPLGVVPKRANGVQTGWRLIFDLSCPDGASVNDGIPASHGAIVYEPLSVAMSLVAQVGRGAMMLKRDLKSAFRYIPVSILDQWCLIFEWNGVFYVELFLPFGLRTAPRIFNLFSEAIHWVLRANFGWSVSHYLDDFFAVFPPSQKPSAPSNTFDDVLAEFGFIKAPEKDESGTVVTHLGFQIDSDKMEVCLPPNKHSRALAAITSLASAKSTSHASLEQTLGFLSHCCQVIPLGRAFLHPLFALLKRNAPYRRIRLNSTVKQDLRWWNLFLHGWSSVTLIQLARPKFEVFTDASGTKGIGGVFERNLFSSRVPQRHRSKHINWKEMFAVLQALILWHTYWTNGALTVVSDNTAVVNGINNRSIRGPAVRPLRSILLLAAIFDIKIQSRWMPSEENIIADAASRHDFDKLANLGFQEEARALRNHLTPPIKLASLRKQLMHFFNPHSPHPPPKPTPASAGHTSPSASVATYHTLQPSSVSPTGLPPSPPKSSQSPSKVTSRHSAPRTSSAVSEILNLTTHASISLSGAPKGPSAKELAYSASLLLRTSSSQLSPEFPMTTTELTLKRRFASASLHSFAPVNSHGIPGTFPPPQSPSSAVNTSTSPATAPSSSHFHAQKRTLSPAAPEFPWPPPPRPPYAPSTPSALFSLATPHCPTHRHSIASTAPSRNGTSSKRSMNTCYVAASPQPASQATQSGKAPPSPPKRKVSLRRISNSLADGKATPLTCTSTTFLNLPLRQTFFL